MSSRALSVIVSTCFVLGCASSYTPRMNTRTDLQNYVNRAAEVVRTKGAGACATFSQPAWKSGDYYVFVTNLDTNVTVCHPIRADFVGQNQDALQDATGRYIAREMQTVAGRPEGSGWIEYVWPRPGETNPVPKSAYVMAVTGPDGTRYLVGSGGYEMPR